MKKENYPTHLLPLLPANLLQLCLSLCNPMDCCLPGSSVHEILRAKVGYHALLWEIFLTQGSDLLHWQVVFVFVFVLPLVRMASLCVQFLRPKALVSSLSFCPHPIHQMLLVNPSDYWSSQRI